MSTDDARGLKRELLAVLRRHGIGAFNGSQVACGCCRRWMKTGEYHEHVAEQLARLIEQREAAARAEAWDEGYEAGHDDEANARWDIGANPYRDRIEQGAGE